MRRLLRTLCSMNRIVFAFLALLSCAALSAQSTAPYNPDANDDSYVGAPDLLSTLAVYGQQVGIDSSLTCDYDGTPVEEWVAGVWDGVIIVDSILIQYHVLDSALVYMAGCPDPVWETVSYERAYLLSSFNDQGGSKVWSSSALGYYRYFLISFEGNNGRYTFEFQDDEVYYTDLDDILGNHYSYAFWLDEAGNPYSNGWYIPFDEGFTMDETGLHFEHWNNFLSGATYIDILPYWHYVE
jgi:hypothetical protein